MTEPDKVTITCYYGDDRKCKQVSVFLNYDDITREDIAACIEAAANAAVTVYERPLDTTGYGSFDVEQFNLNTRKWFGQP